MVLLLNCNWILKMEKINAAIPIVDPSKNVSSQEFQDMLTSWFEKKGILSELRTSLRYKMINVLKNTAIGRDIIRKTPPNSISLSKQAINLIVAEFLMKNNCDYSLSLFNAEAGLSCTFSDNIVNEGNKITLQFHEENILNILELIGVHKTSDLCDEILDTYYKGSENNSLLSALVTVLSKSILGSVDLKRRSDIDLSDEIDFIKKVGTLLAKLNMPLNNVPPAIESIKCLYKSEIQNVENNYSKVMSKLKKHVILKDKQTKEMQKNKELLELKIIQLTETHNQLKIHVKRSIKDKLSKEKELTKIKRSIKESIPVPEQCLDKEIKVESTVDHCGERCNETNKLVVKLQHENEELIRQNSKYLEEISDWKNKYQNLLLDFTAFHHKISLASIKGNQEIPTALLNVNFDSEIKYVNERTNLESTESPDSSTEEIIRDARSRLKLLEDESREIEKKYRKNHPKNKCDML